ncbi:MAG: DUF4918 family protein [Ferruginibacter sp.]|nr:DUF4918 family protein [Ferruginibacter sp.]
MKTFADKVIAFNKVVGFAGNLPKGISMMNPFKENENILPLSSSFYKKYYNDTRSRHLILGINPGRFGGGVTGIPFTDTKRLTEKCHLQYRGKETHEPSSVFVYEMIDTYGGVEKFYSHFYINSVCPLGFTAQTVRGKEINYNYYDSKELVNAVYDFIIDSIRKQIGFGINRDICFCFGTGKNEKFLHLVNEREKFFKKIVALEHPRFVMQYKSTSKKFYIDKYIAAFKQID